MVTSEHCQVPRPVSPCLPKTHPVIGSNAVARAWKHSNPVSKLVILHQRFQFGAVERNDFVSDVFVDDLVVSLGH